MQKKMIYKVLSFMAAAFFSLVAAVYAQAPLRIYTCQKGTVAAHTFSSSSTTYTFTEGTNLNNVWLKANGTTETLNAMSDAEATPQTFRNNISVPEFYFGNAKVRYFGFTGAGCLYFGTDDAILAVSNPSTDVGGSGKLKNFVYLEFYNGTSDALWGKRAVSTPVYAGANASAKYEIVDGTLYVGYENLKIYDNTNSATLPLSFQYKITSDGTITFIPVAMRPIGTTDKETGANCFFFDLALLPGGDKSNGVFLGDLDGSAQNVYTWLSNPQVEITNQSYPRGSYSFTQPAPCEEIANPKVTRWSYDITTNTFEINPGASPYTAWEKGDKCIFILSTKASLTGNDLPQNGTEYSDISGLKIGSSVFAAVAQADPNYGSYLRNKSVSGLTPDTRYYLYAFPYNDNCSNFKYNITNIPRLELKTAMAAPVSLRVEESSITTTGYTVLVDKANNNPYLLGVSDRQISPYTLLNNKIQTKQGGYAKGDVITIGGERIEVLTPCSTDASYQVDGLTAGTERWYYAWSTKADQSEYSYEPICRGFATSRPAPAEVNFDAAASNADMSNPSAGGPAGWLFGDDNDYPFYVYERSGIGKFLSVQMQQGNSGNVAHSTVISPVFESGDVRRVGAVFNLYFWKVGQMQGDYSASKPNATDTLYLQYCLKGQDAWTTIATVTSAASVNGGELSVRTAAFETAGKNFRLRVLVASKHRPGSDGANYASIRSLSVYVPCSEVSALQVSDVMHNSGLVTWEDRGNTPRAGSYAVAWSPSDVAGTQQNTNVLVREATLRGLAPNTTYVVSVRAVCGEGDTSAEQMVPFTTYRGLPYALKTTAEGSIPEEITFRTGELPSTGNAVLQGVDAVRGVWAGNAQETDNTRIALNVATANNPLWLRLPVLSVGNIRGKAHFEAKLSGTDAFNTTDTLFVLLSSDSTFSHSEVLGMVNLSSPDTTINFEFEVTSPHLHISILTKFGENPETGTLFASGIKVEWTDIYCDPVTSLRSSHLAENSVDISWSGEGVKYALLYREDGIEKWDTVFTRENTMHLDDLKSETLYEYYVLTYCDEDGEKVSDKSSTRVFTTLSPCDVPTLELLKGTETTEGIVVVVISPAPRKQLHIRPADLNECPYQMDVMELQRDTTIVRGLTDCEAVTYYVKARAVCLAGASAWTEEQSFTTLKPSTDNSPLERANDALRVRVTSDEIILENYSGEYVKELQAFSSTGRLLAVYPVNSAADVRLAHHLPQGVVLLRAVSENTGTTTFKVIIL